MLTYYYIGKFYRTSKLSFKLKYHSPSTVVQNGLFKVKIVLFFNCQLTVELRKCGELLLSSKTKLLTIKVRALCSLNSVHVLSIDRFAKQF